ncbi:hypothetical protein [Clostridium sp.]|uniref:hypothetical protein n=1 Tax=Clostridium sp. TaxID=1506 RepID=UPI002FC9C5D9
MGSSLFSRVFGFLFNGNKKSEEGSKENNIEETVGKSSYFHNEIDEEDRLVVALAASIMAGKDKPNSHFHISKITRVDNNYSAASFQRANYEIDEEDKLVVALAASIMAGKDKPNSHLHISKITRIDNNYSETPVARINYEIDEEEKLVVALAASIIAGKDKPNSHFRISKLTRVS